ncbi:hypothetical protein E2562_034460 [Oryza meyeriana var. granulata]|uniref:Uncharacterized protein n=1 Tax=Oryza meyeriana var. granulata TaxID=110450 RepID=A0A6G1CW39_9ORYZ|nr:hypothetical protein E2562_034460 [Oryza meyeriana var. granulata]
MPKSHAQGAPLQAPHRKQVVAADEVPTANGEVPADNSKAVTIDEAPAPNVQAFDNDRGFAAAVGGSRSLCLMMVGWMLKAVVAMSLVAFFYSVVTTPTTV